MPPKRKSDSGGAGKSSGKASKQSKLSFGSAAAARPSAQEAVPSAAATGAAAAAAVPEASQPQVPAQPAVLHEYSVLPVLERSSTHTVEQWAQEYKAVWGSKCVAEAGRGRASLSTKDIDLDGQGLRFLEGFKQAFEQACRQGAALPRSFLETLVLILRNDSIHKHPHISRQAYSLLQSYLRRYPAVSLARTKGGRPVVVTNCTRLPQFSSAEPHERSKHGDNFWSSVEDNLTSFSSTYLMTRDMEVSGRKYKGLSDGAAEKRARLDTPLELLHHLFEAAVESDKLNRDGDLMLLRYLLTVLDQDLRCRLTVFAAYEDAAEDEAVQKQRMPLLQNSLLWRIHENMLVNPLHKQQLVGLLMRLIATAGGGAHSSHAGEHSGAEGSQSGEDEESAVAAQACVFTKQQLGGMAAQMLRMLLELFGAAEAAGGFLATGRSRSASGNLRMALERHMLAGFWGLGQKREDNIPVVCRNDALSRAFLRSLAPRDCMRFLGMIVAFKYKRTYNDLESKSWGLGELQRAGEQLESGKEAEAFVDVNMLQAMQCINKDMSRAIKAYNGINMLSTLVSNVALSLHALAAGGGGQELVDSGAAGGRGPALGGPLGQLCKEVHRALEGIVSPEHRESICHLGPQSRLELVHAQMALNALASS